MTASNARLTKCPEDTESKRFWALKKIAAMSEDEAKELIRRLIQRGVFSADVFLSARNKLNGEGI